MSASSGCAAVGGLSSRRARPATMPEPRMQFAAVCRLLGVETTVDDINPALPQGL